MTKKLTLNEIYEKIRKDYDIEEVLKPYEKGGTKENPVKRTSGTLINWLINKKKFPPDIAGAALVASLDELRRGVIHFKGDGSYGSAGDQLAQYILQKCDGLNRDRLTSDMFRTIAGAKLAALEEAVFEMVHSQLPWFVMVVSPGSWRWLRKRKKEKQKNESSQRD